jgi:hypothetical protein
MAEQQQSQHVPGHYSGANPVPTVKKFIESLDKDKAERDRKLDEQERERKKQAAATGDAAPHKPQKAAIEGTQKVVTDPTTGKEVTIEDVNKSMMDQVENPTLSVPNANLQKSTVCIYSTTQNTDKLTPSSLLRPTQAIRWPITNTTKMLPLLLIRSLRAQLPMCPSTARRPTSCSILHRLSVTSQHSSPSRSEQPFCALAYSSLLLWSGRCLVVNFWAWCLSACVSHRECSCG